MPVKRVLPSLECVEEGPSGWAHTEPQVPCSLILREGELRLGHERDGRTHWLKRSTRRGKEDPGFRLQIEGREKKNEVA